MKKIILSGVAALMLSALVSCGGSAPRTTFKITGEVPGLKEGTRVKLRGSEHNFNDSIAGCLAADGTFILEGSVDAPVVCELQFFIDEDDLERSVYMMVENTDLTVNAANIDSIPRSFYFGADGKRLEHNVTISGGEAQRQYAEYQNAVYPFEIAVKQAHYNLFCTDEKLDEETERQREKLLDEAYSALAEAKRKFIYEHPYYYISAYFFIDEIDRPFMFSADELDAVLEKVSACPDSARVARIKKIIDRNRAYVRNAGYTDFSMVNPAGKEVKLSELLVPGKYTMVDFWASWCGPCRASIPHVRELNDLYSDKLLIISASVDSDEADWKKAMEQEKMIWQQFRVPEDSMDTVRSAYRLSSIPYILVFNPEGEIIFAGNNPSEVSELLAEELK